MKWPCWSSVTHTAQAVHPSLLALVTIGLPPAEEEFARTRFVLMADGDKVEVFDPKLNHLFTLGGLSQPTGLAGDSLGRIYVTDTGAGRVVRFLADGTPDPDFAPIVLDHPHSLSLYSFADESQGSILTALPDGGPIGCQWTSDGGAAKCRPQLALHGNCDDCRAAPALPVDDFRSLGGSSFEDFHMLVRSGGGYWRPRTSGGMEALKGADNLRAIAPGDVGPINYYAGVDSTGNLVEWLGDLKPVRTTPLGYVGTAVAVDHGATAWQHDSAAEDGGAPRFGPIVVYVAGDGRVERRVLGGLEGGLW